MTANAPHSSPFPNAGPGSLDTLFCDDTVDAPTNFMRVFAQFLNPDPFWTVKMYDFLKRVGNEGTALDEAAKNGKLANKVFEVRPSHGFFSNGA